MIIMIIMIVRVTQYYFQRVNSDNIVPVSIFLFMYTYYIYLDFFIVITFFVFIVNCHTLIIKTVNHIFNVYQS